MIEQALHAAPDGDINAKAQVRRLLQSTCTEPGVGPPSPSTAPLALATTNPNNLFPLSATSVSVFSVAHDDVCTMNW